MTFIIFYLIRPTLALLEQLKLASPDANILLGTSVLWKSVEPDAKAWSAEDYTIRIKLLFLMNLKINYLDFAEESDFKTFLGRLFGPSPFSVNLFDKWWEIERFDIDENADEVENAIDIATLKLVAPTGVPLLESWLVYLIDKKSRANAN